MEIVRYKCKILAFLALILCINVVSGSTDNINTTQNETLSNIEFRNSTVNEENTSTKTSIGKSLRDDQVNSIIASINKIKQNLTAEKLKINSEHNNLEEAIILNHPIKMNEVNNESSKVEKRDDLSQIHENNTSTSSNITTINNLTANNKDNVESKDSTKTTYVEIMTIEPNNANKNNTSKILEILKHLMPMFNTSLPQQLHNITIIERDKNKNRTFTAVNNITTIVVTYCDKENFTKIDNVSSVESETFIKMPDVVDDYLETETQDDDIDTDNVANLTISEKKDIMEAADYGMKKMHELYNVTEPKLYSMGLWLDDANPARYVAAFNAPSEDLEQYARYGYASLQAAARLQELTSGDGLEAREEPGTWGAGALRQSAAALLRQCPVRGAPKCPSASERYRTHDGTCNNHNRPRWGSAMSPVQRFIPPSYSDGLQAPRRSVLGSSLPSAREISATVHESQHEETTAVTHLLMQWGQFVDHDVTSSSQTRGFNGSVPRCCTDGGKDFVPKELMHPECMPIPVPTSDPFYGPRGVRCLDFVRSSPAPRDDCSLGWREQLNQVSAYIDGSPLYGSSAKKSDKLRLFRNGMLQYGRVQQRRPLLPPERRDELCRGGALSTDCFKSGDSRVNEHPGLVAAHIVWLRLHNRIAQELAHLNPHWSDEKIYQETRKIIGAMIQHITYREFLPVVLGPEVMRLFELEPLKKGYFKGYNVKINPSPASSFGSAAFRFGHSLVQKSMMRFDKFHRPMANNVSLHAELSNPSNIWSMGAVDRLLMGMMNQPIQKRDEYITEELTNHLFQTPQFDFGMDLAAINIQRGRDHGVPSYTTWREPCGLSEIREFDDLVKVMPARVVRKLRGLYRHVDDIDLFTGGISERPVIGGLVGPTFACVIAQQFSNLRTGDRFWYENGGLESSFTPAQLQQIRRISLAQVLCKTLDTINNIQPFAFLSPDNPDNERILCTNGQLNNFDLTPWTEIDSNSDNDIRKSDDLTTKVPMPSTTRTNQLHNLLATSTIKPFKRPLNKNKPKPINRFDELDRISFTSSNNKTTPNVQKIDDKLDFRNKTRRYDDDEVDNRKNKPTKTKYKDYDDYDNVQSIQSVVINNVKQKRPTYNNRPVIAVTENVDKFTYLINYVPRPTQPWRQTTRKPYNDRDVVKVTYQSYDQTYRRPGKPYYYDRQDDMPLDINSDTDFTYKYTRPTRYQTKSDDMVSAARSNDDIDLTQKTETTTTGKLVTFSYLGTFRQDDVIKQEITKHDTDDNMSKDFSTYDMKAKDSSKRDNDNVKLSTFYHYETATRPYSAQRSTRKDDAVKNDFITKYYFDKNELRKYAHIDTTDKPTLNDDKDLTKENYNNPGQPSPIDIQERSADEVGKPKGTLGGMKKRPQQDVAKTPSVAFQIIPSENSPSRWVVYEERADTHDSLQKDMPKVQADPHALKEIPRPLHFSKRKRRPAI